MEIPEALKEPTKKWYLSVFLNENGKADHYSLDYEAGNDCHYLFRITDEQAKELFGDGDDLLHELMNKYLDNHDGNQLRDALEPYIFQRYCFY